MKKTLLFPILGLILLTNACSLLQTTAPQDIKGIDQTIAAQVVATIAAEKTRTAASITTQTFQSEPTLPATPLPSPTPDPTGSISGNLSYPSEYIPELRVVALRVGTEEYYMVETALNQSTYEITGMTPGDYYVLAYFREGEPPDYYDAYSEAILCGLSVDCTDHSLITVSLSAGQYLTGIDPGDWYITPADWGWPTDPTMP